MGCHSLLQGIFPTQGLKLGLLHYRQILNNLNHQGKPLNGENQSSSFAQSCLTLCDPTNCSMLGFPVHHYIPSLLKLMSIESVMPSSHLILCHPLLLLSPIFPIITVLSTESALLNRWPKDWSFSFSISPSNEYSGLISFRMDWFDLLALQGTLKSLL